MGESWERVKQEAMEIITSSSSLPRLVVLDLDYTLWPFYWYIIPSFTILIVISMYAFFQTLNNHISRQTITLIPFLTKPYAHCP